MKILEPIKEFFGEKNEVVTSFNIALEERITSPFYGYFIVSWLIINWKILYVAFFVSQDKIFEKLGLLRHEYLSISFPSFSSFHHLLYFLLYPLLLTIFFFWIFPFFSRKFYRKSLKNQKALRIIEIQETTEQRKEEKKLVREEKELIKEKAEKAKETKKAEREDPAILWEREFTEFKNLDYLKQLTDIVYSKGGRTHTWTSGGWQKFLNSEFLAILDTKGLIVINGAGDSEKITLTEKGKFFLAKYIDSEKNK